MEGLYKLLDALVEEAERMGEKGDQLSYSCLPSIKDIGECYMYVMSMIKDEEERGNGMQEYGGSGSYGRDWPRMSMPPVSYRGSRGWGMVGRSGDYGRGYSRNEADMDVISHLEEAMNMAKTEQVRNLIAQAIGQARMVGNK